MTAETLRDYLEYAPKTIRAGNPDLRGWWITCDDGLRYLCAHCAGRIMARGCSIGQAEPVWKGGPGDIRGVCEGCETDTHPMGELPIGHLATAACANGGQ